MPDPNLTLSYLMSPEAKGLIIAWCKMNNAVEDLFYANKQSKRMEADLNLTFLEETGICHGVLNSSIYINNKDEIFYNYMKMVIENYHLST